MGVETGERTPGQIIAQSQIAKLQIGYAAAVVELTKKLDEESEDLNYFASIYDENPELWTDITGAHNPKKIILREIPKWIDLFSIHCDPGGAFYLEDRAKKLPSYTKLGWIINDNPKNLTEKGINIMNRALKKHGIGMTYDERCTFYRLPELID